MKQLWLKRGAMFAAVTLSFWYGHYCGKTNADHWWKEWIASQPPIKHALIVRPQGGLGGRKTATAIFDSCELMVEPDSVVTILPNGRIELNQTKAQVHNCQFQWVETRGL
jgi:hypothetical protein